MDEIETLDAPVVKQNALHIHNSDEDTWLDSVTTELPPDSEHIDLDLAGLGVPVRLLRIIPQYNQYGAFAGNQVILLMPAANPPAPAPEGTCPGCKE
jgi:hypothetical protein